MKDILTDAINVGDDERIISGGIGAALIAMAIPAIKKPTILTWAELGMGALLVLRGATGYCPVNAAIGRNTAENAEEKFETLAE